MNRPPYILTGVINNPCYLLPLVVILKCRGGASGHMRERQQLQQPNSQKRNNLKTGPSDGTGDETGRDGATTPEPQVGARRMGRTTPELVKVHLAPRSSRSDTSMRRGPSGHRPSTSGSARAGGRRRPWSGLVLRGDLTLLARTRGLESL